MAQSKAEQLPAVKAAVENLEAILQHARTIKTGYSIDPALPVSQLEQSIDQLHANVDADDTFRTTIIETAARNVFYARISATSITDPDFVEVWNLLDVLLLAGDRGQCSPELVCWLLEELLDSQTTEGCRIVFSYLESRRERLAQKDFHKKNLVFLRSCNELLRRLSRAEDAMFCGRVFFFLFQTFPLGDKSSVNLRGEFHIENATVFDETAQAIQTTTGASTPLPDAQEGTSTPSGPKPGNKAIPIKPPKKEEEPLDSNTLYPIFWRLQRAFSEPTTLFTTTAFQEFKKALAATMLKFKKTPTVVQTSAAGSKRKADELDQGIDNYNPKYLTSRDLFDLELSDLAFQRHILLQALILIDFLLSLTEKAKKKLASVEHPNKSMLYDFTLSAEDATWANDTRQSIKDLFYATVDGRFYDRMVDTILARDKNWIRWKIESCPSIVKDAVPTEEVLQVRQDVQRQTKPRRLDARTMGAMDLSFLEAGKGVGLESLRDPSRFATVSAEDLLKGLGNDRLDLEMAMDDEEKTTLQDRILNKTWRILRDLRSSRLSMLSNVKPGEDIEQAFKPPEEVGEAIVQEENGPVTEAQTVEAAS